ncbi:MAG TPA: carbonic anhydrase [Stenomitos sp.]
MGQMFGRNTGFLGRRDLLRLIGAGGVGMAAGFFNPSVASGATSVMDADAALQRLMGGNQRFMAQQLESPHQSLQRVQEVAYSQQPFAVILSCADSRVPAEIVFDEGIGDIFDIRIAGNIVTPEVLGSLEYAIAILGTRLIMVLGHERCGAVTAAVADEAVPGSIDTLVKAIQPAIALTEGSKDVVLDAAVVANVRYQMDAIRRNSPLIAERLLKQQVKLVGGRYDLDSGEVTLV